MTKYYLKDFALLLLLLMPFTLAACSAASPQAKSVSRESPPNEQDIILAERQLKLPFSYIKWAKINEEQLPGYPAKTLTLQFKQPQTVLSSLNGWKENILTVGNHSSGPASWPLTHKLGMEAVTAKLTTLLILNPQTSMFLFTGANMDNLVYVEKEASPNFENTANLFKIGVLVTAGVQTNALRAGCDSGDYWEPGTINIIILSNRKLSPGAMSNMLITATEAKTAALEDLDIRSSASGLPATGTGTDNIIVVSGQGVPTNMSGGHTKLGELLTKAVYEAVIQAIAKQNQLVPSRSINLRLAERGIRLKQLINQNNFTPTSPGLNKAGQKAPPLDDNQKTILLENFQKIIQNPRYAGFMASALALADNEYRGLLPDTSLFSEHCLVVARELAGRPLKRMEIIVFIGHSDGQCPPLLQEALNAILTGIYYRNLAL